MLHTHRDVYEFDDPSIERRRRRIWFATRGLAAWVVLSAVLILLGFAIPVVLVTMGAIAGGLFGYMGVMVARGSGNTLESTIKAMTSVPYEESFSQEDTLLMQRKVPEALAMFEAKIAAPDSGIPVRVRAAELHAKEGANPGRAAELFREIQRHPACDPGQYSYATNRLVDLLTGPLNDPGRAMGELRRLIDRAPGSPAAANAREALAALKQIHRESAES